VDDRVRELILRPLGRIGRQHDERWDDSAGHRCLDVRVREDVNGTSNSSVGGEALHSDSCVRDMNRTTTKTPDLPESRRDRQQKAQCARGPRGHSWEDKGSRLFRGRR
jgi:hypothetical protein